jgi:hypothetical protein
MKNRNILIGIMCIHEIIHEIKRRRETRIVLKLDIEKAYDKVNWDLLFECMEKRGFHNKWCVWMEHVASGGTISVKVNNKIGKYIKIFKGVRQGDPLSPILFNFVADCLTRLIHKAQENNLITCLISHIILKGGRSYNTLTILFFFSNMI